MIYRATPLKAMLSLVRIGQALLPEQISLGVTVVPPEHQHLASAVSDTCWVELIYLENKNLRN